ncbi:hypothetical protein D3C87_321400 [compost metagenome]
MPGTSLIQAIARLIRASRSRSNLRPAVAFVLGLMSALLGVALGTSNTASSALCAVLILAGVALGALAVAAIMLRPDAANDN